MAGLIYKDICCLKKSLRIFVVITLGTIGMAVLFILSMKYGNVAKITTIMSQEEFFEFFQVSIWCVLILPIASSAMIQECFKEDTKANFQKCLYTLPVKEEIVVGSRYLTGVNCLFLGFLGTLVASGSIALTTDAFRFTQLLAYSVTFLAILIVYEAFVMFVLYTVNGKKADLIQCIPLVLLLFLTEYFFMNKARNMTDEQLTEFFTRVMEKVNDLMLHKCIWILLASLLLFLISYMGSVYVQKKRGFR